MRSGVFHLKSTVWRGVLQITSARIHVTRSVNHALTVTTRFLNGFSFVARQKWIVVDGDDFRIDLVFYNRLLQCFVLFDIKMDKITHQDLGQLQMYVNFYDRSVKTDFENPTIGVKNGNDSSLTTLNDPTCTQTISSKAILADRMAPLLRPLFKRLDIIARPFAQNKSHKNQTQIMFNKVTNIVGK